LFEVIRLRLSSSGYAEGMESLAPLVSGVIVHVCPVDGSELFMGSRRSWMTSVVDRRVIGERLLDNRCPTVVSGLIPTILNR
jgi:hypothetical protein